MADSTNPSPSGNKSYNFLPRFFQSDSNKKFLQATVDQLVQPGTVSKVNGYIGRQNAKATTGDDIFIAAANSFRQQYQLEPGFVVNDELGNNIFFKDYQDYINQLEVFGSNVSNHARLNTQEMYSWDPHIDWDKFVNFQNYYWLPYGPDVVAVRGQQEKVQSTFKVTVESESDNNVYVFTPDGLTRNPLLKLYRGQTYRFEIDSPGNPFSFKTARTAGQQDRYIDSGLDKHAVTKGTITFTVPYGSPDVLYYLSENDIDLGGVIHISSINENTSINVDEEVLGKKTYKLDDGTELTNGMKIRFIGNVSPEQYANGYYYVEGVGTGITLVNETTLELVSAYTSSESILFDTIPFDSMPWSDATAFAGTKDYVVINRASVDHNPWTRYNRWFHKDTIEASAIANGKVPSLDQTARAVRPIIEFEANLRLYNFGTTAYDDVDLIDTYTTDVFSTIEGSAGYNVDGVNLVENQRILFKADTDVFVKNKIYRVTFVTLNNNRQIHLVLEDTPEYGAVVLVKQGKNYQGSTFWYDGATWQYAQQKTQLNQSPLFDLYDNNNNSFGDITAYDGSTFRGTKLFSYKIGAGTVDSNLGFALSYKNINNIGDIVFNFNMASDSFQYKNITTVLSKETKVGYLQKQTTSGMAYVTGWQLCKVPTTQAAIRIYKNTNKVNNFLLDIFDDVNDLADLVVKVYVNGIRLDASKWAIHDGVVYKTIVLDTDILTSDVLTIRAFAAQAINNNGYYEVPVNLQNNPLNESITTFTLGEVIDHVSSIVDNLTDFSGEFPGTSNIRNLGNITPYGTKFVQHSGPASLSLYHITSQENNIVRAIEKARDDYNKFKRNFISVANSLGVDTDPVTHVNLILQKINKDKPSSGAYYFSDMVPFGANITADIEVLDARTKTYPLSTLFSLDSLSNRAVIVYHTGVTTNVKTQLLHGRDYTFSTQGFIVVNVSLTEGDVITICEYESTTGSFVPATPTKLGLWPKYEPKKYYDTSLVTPRWMLQGHDGSQILAYGDFRDDLVIELEKRIYNNIKVEYNPDLFDINDIVPAYNRTTQYSLNEFNIALSPSFFKWTSFVDKDFSKPLSYDRANSLTFNYKGHGAPDGRPVPGYWRGIYRWMLDTDRPNLCPWEMLGLSEEPTWWQDLYGPAPYTCDNLVMWQDLTDGMLRVPGQPAIKLEKYTRPFLMEHIPVDNQGNILSPVLSGLVEGVMTSATETDFVFGDVSPIEAAWRRSSYYPFSVLLTGMLLQPAKTFGTGLDRSRIVRNLAGQIVYSDTNLAITPADLKLPSIYTSTTSVLTSGIINYIIDYILSDNQKSYASYVYDLKNINATLSYRIGAFTSKEKFNLLLDSKTPLSQGSVFIPQEDYSIILNSSSPVKKITYSGVIVTKVPEGYEVKGYSRTQPFFKYYAWTQTGIDINVGGISESYLQWTASTKYASGKVIQYNGKYYRTKSTHTSGPSFTSSFYEPLTALPVIGGRTANFRRSFDRTDELVAPYGTRFRTIQEVVDFLLGYGEYLKDQGFIFDEFNNTLNTVTNWETSAKEFLFWTTQNWSSGQDKWTDWQANNETKYGEIVQYNGDYYRAIKNSPASTIFEEEDFVKLDGLSSVGSAVISLSPAAAKLTFSTTLCVVDDVTSSFNGYEIFKVDGTPIEPNFLNSYRETNSVSYQPSTDDGIFGASFYLIQKEQVLLINNTTMFNDTIYNPASGYRQERIKVAGYISTDWYGGFNVPGFIFDQAKINQWTAWKDYSLGDIVKYKEFYYSAKSFLAGTETFVATDWIKLDKAPTPQLLPNWTYKASQFTDFYSLDSDNFDPDQQRMAQHLIGYQKRQYLSNIIKDDVSEFKFYQGMIIEKGTQNVLNKLFDVLSADGQESLKFYEEWALRVGQYGANESFDNIEFVLDETLFKNNPQGFELVNEIDSTKLDFIIRQTLNDVYLKPLGYNSNPFPLAKSTVPFLRTPGYVRPDEVSTVLLTKDDILSVDISSYTNGDYIWCGFEGREWNVYRYTDSNIKITEVTYDETEKVVTFTTETLPEFLAGDIIGIKQSLLFDSFYKIKSVSLNTFTIDKEIVKWPDPYTEHGRIVVFVLKTQRVTNKLLEDGTIIRAIDRADEVLPSTLKEQELVWIDDDGTGKWQTWQYNPVYSEAEIFNSVSAENLAYGRKVIINSNGTIAIVSNNLGELIVYDKASVGDGWIQRQTIVAPFVANSGVGNPTPDSLTGDVMALSANARWLATGTPLANLASTAYSGTVWDINNSYVAGVIVTTEGGSFYRAKRAVASGIEITNLTYWKNIPYVPVNPYPSGSNSGYTQQGVITIYEKDSNNTFSILDTIISPMPANDELFGCSLAFGDNMLFVGAKGANNGDGKVYKLDYATRERAQTFYNPAGSSSNIIKVTSTAGIEEGMAPVGAGFSDQVVTEVIDSTTLRLNYAPDSEPVGIIKFTATEWGYGTAIYPVEQNAQFGSNISISLDNSTLVVSAPGDNSNGVFIFKPGAEAGSYLLVDNKRGPFDNATETVLEPLFGISTSVSNTGEYIVLSSVFADKAKMDQGTVIVYKYNGETYDVYQELTNANPESSEFFGTKVAFMNDYKTLVVYSQNADSYTSLSFDYYADNYDAYTYVNKDGQTVTSRYVNNPTTGKSVSRTTFDDDITSFVTKTINGGRVDVYDMYGTKWIYSESLKNENIATSSYGEGFAVGSNYIVVSAPYAEIDGFKSGRVYQYSKSAGTYSWNTIHREISKPDVTKVKQAFLYNKETNKLVTYIDVIDSTQGKISGVADAEIKYKTFYDPAVYSVGNDNVNVDDGMAWTTTQVGMLWWDLRSAKFYDSHDDDIVYRNSTWNTLFPGASIDVYEWVESKYLPSSWDELADTEEGLTLGISGTSLYGDTAYSIIRKYDNVAKTFKNTYYYWVKNKKTVPNVSNRKISSQDVADLISNPRGKGYKYLALTSSNSFSLVNIKPSLEDTNIVLSLEYWTVENTEKNIHTQWKLISSNPSTEIPQRIEDKWFDSLCGKDSQDRIVPDPSLPIKLRYGIENRPRQSMFVNRFEALKQLIEQTNQLLIKHQISEQRDLTILGSFDEPPAVITGTFDTTLDTDAELRFAGVGTFKQPSLIPVIEDGRIVDVTIVEKGSGYLIAPYVTVIGPGSGAKIRTIINTLGQVTGVDIISSGTAYNENSTYLSVRNYTVLVKSDSESNGNWSTYAYEPSTQVWSRILTQTFDTRKYWTYVDWYATGVNQFTSIDHAVASLAEINSISVEIGQRVKVLTNNTGNWMLLEKFANSTSIDWTQSYSVVGMQNGTIQLSPTLYSFANTSYGYDGTLYDIGIFDNAPAIELRNILIALRDNILIDNLKEQYLELFFTAIRYVLTEQNFVDWIFKTSFVKVQHNVGELKQKVTYNNDNLSDFEAYVGEVKPYRTSVREYISNYTKVDNTELSVTDFDLPPIFEDSKITNIETTVVSGKVEASSTMINSYPWKHWLDNVGFNIVSLDIVDGGSGYITEPVVRIVSNSGTGATARAFISNGKVNRIVLSSKGQGYLSAPTIVIDGGMLDTGKPATVVAKIGNSVVRSNLVKMKFDRITQSYYITQLQEIESFAGTGSRLQFPLTWAPDTRVGKSTVLIDGIPAIRDNYRLSIVKSTTRGYTSYSGSITFTVAPPLGTVVDVTYIKDWSLLNAADRIQYYYDPATGELGKDLAQLMTGIDYGGVVVTGMGFDVSGGWGTLPFYSDKWDSFDGTFDDYITTVAANTRTFTLPYTPDLGTEINVYYSQVSTVSYVSDGILTGYNFSTNDIFPPTVYASKESKFISSANNVAGSDIITVRNIPVTVNAAGINGEVYVTVDSARGIYIGMVVTGSIGLGAGTVTVVDIFGEIIQLSVENIGLVDDTLTFTDTTDTGTRGIKVGDVFTLSPGITNAVGYNTKVVEIINSTDVRLDQILFQDIPVGTTAVFTRELVSPVDCIKNANGTVELDEPIEPGCIITITSFKNAVRIDDPDYGTPQQTNPLAVMPTWIGDGTSTTVDIFLSTPVDERFTVNEGDQFVLRKSTSDGAIKPQENDYDTALSGGDLAYLSATGIRAEDIIIDGDDFVTPTSSPAPEEVVPGQVVDTVAIKVYDRPPVGSANIKIDGFLGDGNTTSFVLTQKPNTPSALVVKLLAGIVDVNGNPDTTSDLQTLGVDYTYDYVTNEVTFVTPPAVGKTVSIYSIGVNGENILDLDYFVGDGTTREFITRAPWLSSVTYMISINGIPETTVEIFQTDTSYESSNRIGIRFVTPPAADAIIDFIIVSGSVQTFAVTKTQRIAMSGLTDTYELDRIVGDTKPLESSMIVRVDDTTLRGPVNSYFKVGGVNGLQLNYTISPTKFLPYSVSISDIVVLVSGQSLSPGVDYNVDLSGITIKLNQLTRDTYKGKELIISIKQGQGYTYLPATDTLPPRIKFAQVYDPNHIVEVITSYKHDILAIQETAVTITSNVQITPDTTEFYEYRGLTSGTIILDRTVINSSYVWVSKNGKLLTPGIDFKLNDDKQSITLSREPDLLDEISYITFSSNVLSTGIAYMQFKDMLNRVHYKRLALAKQTTLALDLKQTDTTITVDDASMFDIPNIAANKPGIIEIRGERIEYFTLNGNVLGQLRRGTLGTSTPLVHKTGSFVQDIGSSETIPYTDTTVVNNVVSDGSTTVGLTFVPGNFGTDWTYKGTAMTADDALTLAKSSVEVFAGGIRLKKNPYAVHSIAVHPESPEGDVSFNEEFTVDNVTKAVELTTPVDFGTRITVAKRTGTVWDSTTNIMNLDDKIARFLKDSPGIWYNTLAKYEKKLTTSFDSGAGTFDSSDITFDQG